MTIGITGYKYKIPESYITIGDRTKRFLQAGKGDVIDLAELAGLELLDEYNIDPHSINLLLFGGAGNLNRLVWSPSAKLQYRLGVRSALSFDVFNGCNSLNVCLRIAADYLRSLKLGGRVMVLLGDQLSNVGDINNPNHACLWSFGDSAAALLIESNVSTLCLAGQSFTTEGRFHDDMWYDPAAQRTFLDSDADRNEELSAAYVKYYPEQIAAAASVAGIKVADLKRIVMNQGNPKIIEATETALGIVPGSIIRTFAEYGHLGSIDVLLGFDLQLKAGIIGVGDYVAWASSSVGYTWGCTVLRV